MKQIYVVTEGQTETNFVKRILNPYFSDFDKILIPTTVVTSRDRKAGKVYKGGMQTFKKAHVTISNALAYARKSNVFATTMFDYYRLPNDTPGMDKINSMTDPYQRVDIVEKEMLAYEKLDKSIWLPTS